MYKIRTITVNVKTNKKANRIKIIEENKWDVELTEKPVAGKANELLIELMAQELNVNKNQLILSAGTHSKKKIIKILYN
ncbi:MAG TPA: DUF167 family protein [Patescibacteria group bacterium]